MKANSVESNVNQFFFLRIKKIWSYFWSESLAFKCICAFLFIEFFRPQSIFTFLSVVPWGSIFLGLAILSSFLDKDSKFRITKFHILILTFAVIVHLSFTVAFNIHFSQKYYINFIQWIIVFFVVSTIVTNKTRFYAFFIVWFACVFKIALGTAKVWALRGFAFTSWGLMGPQGYFQNSGELAILMLTLFPVAYYLYQRLKKDIRLWERLVLLLAVITPVLTILGASSRGAQIALLVQLILMFWKRIFRPRAFILIALVLWAGWNLLPAEQKERFTSIGEDRSSIQRKLYWNHGWDMMKDYPILGVGYYNFIPYYAAHYPDDVLYDKVELPHNIFIQVGTDAGFTGLLLFVSIILTSLLSKYPKSQSHLTKDEFIFYDMWKGIKLGVVGFTIAGQFVTVAYYPFLWYAVAMQVCILSAMKSSNGETLIKHKHLTK